MLESALRRRANLPILRLLAESWQAFEALSARHVRQLGLTPAQFDVIATLGNTAGMSFRELGQRTLITKGTLTGVVDRLEAAGMVARQTAPRDGRSTIVTLTAAGVACFEHVFPAHLAHVAPAFDGLDEEGRRRITTALVELRDRFLSAAARQGGLVEHAGHGEVAS